MYIKLPCRICKCGEFTSIIDLGMQYIANHYNIDPNEEKAPLHLVKCNICGLVQLEHAVDPQLMYKNYWYRSSINFTMRRHLTEIVYKCKKLTNLQPGDTVLDIGCNDGTLLGSYENNITKVGIDPSNIEPNNTNIFINDYFSSETYGDLPKPKIITSIAMFYDLNNPIHFVNSINKILPKDGVWCVEISYLPDMLKNNSYDTICHEHVAYYTIETFNRLLTGTELNILDIEFNDMNCGSFRLFLNKKPNNHIFKDEPISESIKTFNTLAQENRKVLLDIIRGENGKVYGYGASTKGQVLLQYCGLNNKDIIAIADKNPQKHGLKTPGTNIPICSEEQMRNDKPNLILMLPWHFSDEFVDRERQLLQQGSKFIKPLPKVEIIGY